MPATPRRQRTPLLRRRPLELAELGALHDPFEVVRDLLRVAHHHPSTVAPASSFGLRPRPLHADDVAGRAAAKTRDDAIAFLAVNRRTAHAPRPAAR